MSLYRKILKQALDLSWKNKYLWFFGLFAALLGGGEYEIITRSLTGGQDILFTVQEIFSTNVLSGQSLSTMGNFMKEDPISFAITVIMGIIFLVLFLFIVWLVLVSQAALVNNSASILAGKKHDFKTGMNAGIENFWPTLGYNAIVKVIITVSLLITSIPIVLSRDKVSILWLSLLYMVLFIVFVLAMLSISFVFRYALAYKIIKNEEFVNSIKKGWHLFKENWLISLEMAITLFIVSFLVGLAAILAILILAIPLLFLAFVFYYLTSFVGFWLVVILAMVIFLLVIILSGSILSTFQTAAWTGLFMEIVSRGGTSKIVRVMGKYLNR